MSSPGCFLTRRNSSGGSDSRVRPDPSRLAGELGGKGRPEPGLSVLFPGILSVASPKLQLRVCVSGTEIM